MAQDSQIALQSSSSTPITPGARTVIVTVLINGVPTPVQMQAIAISDAQGVVIDFNADALWKAQVIQEMREIRKLLASFMGIYQAIPDAAAPVSDVSSG